MEGPGFEYLMVSKQKSGSDEGGGFSLVAWHG